MIIETALLNISSAAIYDAGKSVLKHLKMINIIREAQDNFLKTNSLSIELQDELQKIFIQAFRQAVKSYCDDIEQLCQKSLEYENHKVELEGFVTRVRNYVKNLEEEISSGDQALLNGILPFLSGMSEHSPLGVTEELTKNFIAWLINKEGQDLPEAAHTLLMLQDSKTPAKSFGMLVITHFQETLLNGKNPRAVVALELYYFSKIRDDIAKLQTTIDQDLKRPLDAISYELSRFALQAHKMSEKLDQKLLYLTSDVKQLRQEIKCLAKQLNFIPLDPKNYQDQMVTHITALNFENQGSDYIGRKQAIKQLQEFLDCEASVCWWQISGDGGQGKSRLALHLLNHLEPSWRAGFISADDLAATDWRQISFRHPTLIIIDYLSGQAKTAHFVKALQNLEIYQQDSEKQIRFLILDRVGFCWQRQSTDPISWYDYVDLSDRKYIHNTVYAPEGNPAIAQSLHLTDQDLSVQEMQKIMISYRHKQNTHCDHKKENRKYQDLDQDDLDMLISWMQEDIYNPDSKQFEKKKAKTWRPLFAMIFASLFEEIRAENLTKTAEDPIYQALDHVYKLERQTYWRDQTGKDKKMSKQAVNLACLTTMIGSFDLETDFERLQQKDRVLKNFYDTDDPNTDHQEILSDTLMVLGQHVWLTPGVEYSGNLLARQPDLLGEFMILFELKEVAKKGFGGDLNRIQTLAQDAFQLNPVGFEAFLIRLSQDFGRHHVFRQLAKTTLALGSILDKRRFYQKIEAYAYFGLVGILEETLKILPSTIVIDFDFLLFLSSQQGHADCIELLLKYKVDVNQIIQKDGVFPLLMACQQGHADCIEILLREGAVVGQINQKDGIFPLLMACQEGHVECVKLLLENNANSTQINHKSGTFPLLMAAKNGHGECIKLLLEKKADPWQEHEATGGSPVIISFKQKQTETAQLFADHLKVSFDDLAHEAVRRHKEWQARNPQKTQPHKNL